MWETMLGVGYWSWVLVLGEETSTGSKLIHDVLEPASIARPSPHHHGCCSRQGRPFTRRSIIRIGRPSLSLSIVIDTDWIGDRCGLPPCCALPFPLRLYRSISITHPHLHPPPRLPSSHKGPSNNSSLPLASLKSPPFFQ